MEMIPPGIAASTCGSAACSCAAGGVHLVSVWHPRQGAFVSSMVPNYTLRDCAALSFQADGYCNL